MPRHKHADVIIAWAAGEDRKWEPVIQKVLEELTHAML